jgi:WD40 repeat protein
MRTCLLFLGGMMILGAVQSPAADETRPFSVHDMLAMERVSDWQVSPDGRLAVFGVSTTDLDANRRRNRLWLVETDGAGLKPLTSAAGGDAHPRWSPDGRSVLFLSSRSGSSQIWRIAVDGGEAEQVTRLPLDVGSFAVSPDGRCWRCPWRCFRTARRWNAPSSGSMPRRRASPAAGFTNN